MVGKSHLYPGEYTYQTVADGDILTFGLFPLQLFATTELDLLGVF